MYIIVFIEFFKVNLVPFVVPFRFQRFHLSLKFHDVEHLRYEMKNVVDSEMPFSILQCEKNHNIKAG